jgi:hypothetical protein
MSLRKALLLSLIILCAPAARAAGDSVAGCQTRLIHSYRRMEFVIHNESMLHALRASNTIKKAAARTIGDSIRLSHAVAGLERRISRNPQLLNDPRIRSMLCLAARAMHDYSGALRDLVVSGERRERGRQGR